MTPKRAELIVETTFATLFVTALVLGAALPGPWVLRVMLILGGIYGLSCAFYSIFERLQRTCEPKDWGPDGDDPDDGERAPPAVLVDGHHGPFMVRRVRDVIEFPRKAA